MLFGPILHEDAVEFRLWAPLIDRMAVRLDDGRECEMQPMGDGWYGAHVAGTGVGSRYQFVFPSGLAIPDPASRFQPLDVHGPSEVVDLSSYIWKTPNWRGRPWEEIVLYELHIGAFSPKGNFLGVIDHLDHLADLGVTALQIMPIGDFPGSYGWGYDGVLPYAPESSYGRPQDFMALIDAAHERGLCVFLDVVYNHFGPDGNYLPVCMPLFTENHQTPWGDGINYDDKDSEVVREFVIENAIYWITEFRLDGLRLDAVHAIKDDSEEHLLSELSRRVRAAAGDRHVHLVVENEENDGTLLKRGDDGKAELFTAQWNDDIHHVLHIAATGECFAYYADYGGDTTKIGQALAEGFVFQGEYMPYKGDTRGTPTTDLPPTAFVSFIQNHDQIGNRVAGDRMIAAGFTDALKAITAIYLLAPQIPMLFMGEEWGAEEPFPYFCDFNDELNAQVRQGRRDELSRLPGFDAENIPDATAQATFAQAKLNWSRRDEARPRGILRFYKTLLDIRHDRIVPLLKAGTARTGRFQCEGPVINVHWPLSGNTRLQLLTNLGDTPAIIERDEEEGDMLFALGMQAAEKTLSPWSVRWSLCRDG